GLGRDRHLGTKKGAFDGAREVCCRPPSGSRRLAGGIDESAERLGIADCDVGEDLAVELDPCQLEAVDQLRVGHPALARASVDAGDPQPAEVALAVAPVAVGVGIRLHQRFLGALVVRVRLAAEALGQLERRATLLLGVDRALDAGHQPPSSFLTRGASWSEIAAGLPRWRLCLADFFSRMWLVKA